MQSFNLHMVSDSTGETVNLVARACLVQYKNIEAKEHLWTLVRNVDQIDEILQALQKNPGFVVFTLVNEETRSALEKGCRRLQIPCISALDPVVNGLGAFLGAEVHAKPGRQHVMDVEYFNRIEAMHYVLSHDDGQSTWDLGDADIILLGVSRTSKTPTCMYLANRGIRAANIPIVPGCSLPENVFNLQSPLIIGLTKNPKRLVEIRRQRLRMLEQDEHTDYVDMERVSQEVLEAKKLYLKNDWPIINVSRKSIEETAATILQHYRRHQEKTTTLGDVASQHVKE